MKRKPFRLLPETAARSLRKFWNFIYELFRSGERQDAGADFGVDATPDEGAFLCSLPEHPCDDDRWGSRDVMVGALRTPEQLHYTLSQCRYYAPDRFLPAEPNQIRYIALHEEGIGTEPGIKLWGVVVSVRSLPRSRIPVTMRPGSDPGEQYREYTVKEWMRLPYPIRLLDSYRGRPRFTTKFLLTHCTRSYQLFTMTSQEDFNLMQLLDRMFEAMRNDPAIAENAEFPFGQILFHLTNGMLTATDESGFLPDTVPMDWLARHPRAGFCRIKQMLKRQDELT